MSAEALAFGTSLAGAFKDGQAEAPGGSDSYADYSQYMPEIPIEINAGGIVKGKDPGLFDLSIGKALDPSTFPGAIATGVASGAILLLVGMMLRK